MSGDEQRVPIDGGGGVFDTEDAAQRGGKPKQKEPPKISRGDCFDDGQINNPAAARAEIFDTEAGGSPRKPTTTGVSLEQTPQELRALREEAEAQADEDERTIERWRKTLFVFVCILELLLNMDAGVLPATISHIMTEFGLEYASAGSLGSLVYFGLVLSSPLAGYALTNFRSQRYVMVAAVTLNAAMVFAFALSNNVTLLFVARTLMGFAQAPLFIYAPVWCDEFAPEGQSATWIAILQANVAVGIMLGYMFAGTTTTQWEQPGICKALSEVPLDEAIPDCTIIETGEPGLYYNPHWREPLLVQGVMLVLYVPAMCALKGRYVNARGGKEHCFGYKFEEDMIGSLLSAGWEWLLMTLASLEHHHTGTKHIYDARIGVQERKKHRVKKLMADALLRSHKAAVDRAGAGQRGKPSHLLRDTDRVGSFDLAQDDSEDDDEVALPNDDVLGGDDERYIGDDERIKLRGDINGGGMLRRLRGRDPFTELGKVAGHDGKGAHLSNLMIGESLGMLEMFHGIFHHDDGDNMADAGLKRQLHMMATSKVFVCLTLALSGVYFCVTGMQYWITDYMTQPREQGGIGAEPELVVLCFSIASLTAPTGGVLIGGYIIDRQGGYEDASGAAAARTLRTCAVFGVLSFIFAIPSAFSTNFWHINVGLWFVLFWGGALLSPATGVCINAVHPDLRSFSSAISMLVYNLLGYGASPFLCGVVAQAIDLRWGFRMVILASVVPLITIMLAWRVAVGQVVKDSAGSDDEGVPSETFKGSLWDDEEDGGTDDDGSDVEVGEGGTEVSATGGERSRFAAHAPLRTAAAVAKGPREAEKAVVAPDQTAKSQQAAETSKIFA